MQLKRPAAHLSSWPSFFVTKRPADLAARRWHALAAFAAAGSSMWLRTGVACGDGDPLPPPLPTVSVASPPVSVEVIPVTGSVAEIVAVPAPTALIVPLFGAAFGATATDVSLDAYTTFWVMFFVLLSSNVPVAEKFTVVPTERLAVDGETTRLTRRGVAVGVGVGPVRLGVTTPEGIGVAGPRTVNVASPPPLELAPVTGSTAEMMAVPGPTAFTRLLFVGSLGATTTLGSLEL